MPPDDDMAAAPDPAASSTQPEQQQLVNDPNDGSGGAQDANDPLAGVPPLTTYVAEDGEDKIADLSFRRLIARHICTSKTSSK